MSCSQKKTELVWDKSLYEIGSQSSPKAADLNGDGVLDIVMGAGTAEIAETDQGVVALDGQTGEELWTQSANAHMVGSASFHDITEDGTPDVFIGGRNQNLKALDGKSGAIIWEYVYQYEDHPVLQYARYNFYNSTFVPDQNQDGHPELLTVNGGNWNAAPGSTDDRFPGLLMLLNPVDGAVIAADTMPDGKESYMSPLAFSQPGSEELTIIFGSGGETASGALYKTTLADLKAGRLDRSRVIASEEGHGFIAPPVLADITGDGYYDLIAVSHAGTVTALDGQTWRPVWSRAFPGMEASNTLAVGQFTGDETPDLFAIMSKGKWPLYTISMQVMMDGSNGEIAYQDSIGCFGLGSPVAYDLNDDGYDEVIFSINEYDCNIEFTEEVLSPPSMNNQLIFLNFRKGAYQVIDRTDGFKNLFSTPWIGDLDSDGYLDIVYCQYFNPQDIRRFLGMRVKRISTSVWMHGAPEWGEYMGNLGKGRYPL